MVDEYKRAQRLSSYKDKELTKEEQKVKQDYLRGHYSRGTETPLDDYDEPKEIREAIDDTPSPSGGFWSKAREKVKGAFIKSDEEVALEREAKEYEKKIYTKERRDVLFSKARERATSKARGDYGGLARALKTGVQEAYGVKPKKKKKKKKFKQKYTVINGVAYPVATPRIQTQTPPYTRRNVAPRRNLDDILIGGGFKSNNKNPLDILGGDFKKKKKGKNPLDMLGGF